MAKKTTSTVENDIDSDVKYFNMRLLNNEYLANIPPRRFPAGSVLTVDEDTAVRWLDYGVAEPAPAAEETYREKERERKQRMMRRLEMSGAEAQGSYDRAITRDSFATERAMPRPMPRGRRAEAARADLEDEQVMNAERADDEAAPDETEA